MEAAIKVADLTVARGGKPVLHAVSLEIAPGEVTALIGANGAGKSTLVMTVAGALKPLSGSITFDDGALLTGLPPERIKRLGISTVPEGHQVLARLTALDNLRAAGSMLSRSDLDQAIARVLDLFPELKERLSVPGRSLSGGQKQMLAISQALIAQPKFLLIDELSFGLAPTVVRRLTGAIETIASEGVGILLIEQFTTLALAVSTRAYVLERGRLVFEGTAADLRQHPEILHSAYFPT